MSDDRKYWHGTKPENCQWCGGPLNGVMVDGATRRGWAILCESCHDAHGYGLGVGKGQKYRFMPEAGKWLKDNGQRPEANRTTDLQMRLFKGR